MLCLGVVQSAHSITQSSTLPNLPEVRARLQKAEARQAIAEAGLASLFKTDTTLAGTACGDSDGALFASAMACSCPARLAGLSGGYMGELDVARHAALLERVRLVRLERAALAQHIDALDLLAAAIAAAATVQLKVINNFIGSLRAGEASGTRDEPGVKPSPP